MHQGKHLIILNPTAAQGSAAHKIPKINETLRARGIDFDVVLTERIGHAAEIARDAGESGYRVAVAAGGDGTANEVINGLMAARDAGKNVATMGLIPIGRGNDFAHGVKVPHDVDAAIDIIANLEPLPLDVGIVIGGDYPKGKYFGNGIGVGFDTIVGLEAAKMKWVKGSIVYVFGALKTLVIYPKAPDIRIRMNGNSYSQKSHQISIMNGQRMGGSFFMAPAALVDDGLLHFCLMEDLNRREMLGLIGMYTKGTQDQHPKAKTGSAPEYLIEADMGGLVCHADGETICVDGKALEVRCVKHALKFLRPGA